MVAALDETDDDAGKAAQPSRPQPRTIRTLLPLILGALVIVLVVAGVALWLTGKLPHHNRTQVAGEGMPPVEKTTYVDVPDIIANLDTGSHRSVFVKLHARIALSHASAESQVVAAMPRILDTFQTYLRSMRPDEIHGGEGTYRLREALMNRIDILIAPAEVQDILFVEMLVQ